MSSLYKKLLSSVEKTLINKCHISSGDNILIALSGGSDSVFLFHILYALKDKLGFSIACAHLNHSLREEADAEECFVSELCRTLGITLHTKKSDITKIASDQVVTFSSLQQTVLLENNVLGPRSRYWMCLLLLCVIAYQCI